MKKQYIQPQLVSIACELEFAILNGTGGNINNTPQDNIQGGAPMRQFSGEVQGLKYLI